mmetsp:Transcript_46213/g.144535  ORF Transcript_46213/g.144535 Transcript_46213/m.144535 type:complete len:622 (-) Transcript_46213:133-1998(-)
MRRSTAITAVVSCLVLRTALGQIIPPTPAPPVLVYDSLTADTAIAIHADSENNTVIYYTLDGSDPSDYGNNDAAIELVPPQFIHVEESSTLRALAISTILNTTMSAEATLSVTVTPGRFGKAFIVPHHNALPAYSGRVVEMDLETSKYNSIRIHNIFTDLADYYSTGGVGPYVQSLDSDNPETQVYVRDVSIGDGELVGFQKGFSYTANDGARYGIFVPYFNGHSYSGKVVRIALDNFRDDAYAHFTDNGDGTFSLCDPADPLCLVKVLDLTNVNPDLRGFVGGFSHEEFGYLVPFFDGTTAGHIVAKVDLEAFDEAGVTVLDLFNGAERYSGYFGGFTYGDYGYIVPSRTFTGPLNMSTTSYTADGFTGEDVVHERSAYGGDHLETFFSGHLVRFPLASFDDVQVMDLTLNDTDLRGFSGGFHVGKYGFLVPFQCDPYWFHGKIPKIDLDTFTLIDVLDLQLEVNDQLGGFVGGMAYGKYGVLVPFRNGRYDVNEYGREQFGKVVRFDAGLFSAESVDFIDLPTVPRQQVPARADTGLRGFVDGFTLGTFVYLVPHFNGIRFGKVVRIDMRDFTAYAEAQAAAGYGSMPALVTGNDGIQYLDLFLNDPKDVGFSGGFVIP